MAVDCSTAIRFVGVPSNLPARRIAPSIAHSFSDAVSTAQLLSQCSDHSLDTRGLSLGSTVRLSDDVSTRYKHRSVHRSASSPPDCVSHTRSASVPRVGSCLHRISETFFRVSAATGCVPISRNSLQLRLYDSFRTKSIGENPTELKILIRFKLAFMFTGGTEKPVFLEENGVWRNYRGIAGNRR